MEKVDRRRQAVYRYIIDRIGAGSSPSMREICHDLHIPSTSTVHADLKALEKQGLIEMTDGLNRTIRIPGSSNVLVPLVGTITAGQPILAVEQIERYIPVGLLGVSAKELFALRVRGDSMQDAAILDGDIVVFAQTPVAENGQIVAALVEEEATVKRFYKENGHFRLQPENDSYEPIILDEVSILGRALSVIRVY